MPWYIEILVFMFSGALAGAGAYIGLAICHMIFG